MEDNSDVVVAPENNKTENKQGSGDNLFTLLLKFLKGIVDVFVSLIKSFIAFFWALGASAKLTFIIILVIFCATAYYFGYSNGKEAERNNLKSNPSSYYEDMYDDVYDDFDTNKIMKELQKELNKPNSGSSKNEIEDAEGFFNFLMNR